MPNKWISIILILQYFGIINIQAQSLDFKNLICDDETRYSIYLDASTFKSLVDSFSLHQIDDYIINENTKKFSTKNIVDVDYYFLKNGNTVSITTIMDSLFYYKETRDQVTYTGQITRDKNTIVRTDTMEVWDPNNEDYITHLQHYYSTMKMGTWYESIDSNYYQFGNYKDGKKHGNWIIKHKYFDYNIIIATMIYDNGKMIDSIYTDLSQSDLANVTSLLRNHKWKFELNYDHFAKGYVSGMSCRKDTCKYKGRKTAYLEIVNNDSAYFNANLFSSGSWKIDEDRELHIGDYLKLKILYISKDWMVIK